MIDLYVVSVLLDAGAGNKWTYSEVVDGQTVWKGGRSEALAVASYHMFLGGVFSSIPGDPLRVDGELLVVLWLTPAAALKRLTPDILAKHFQVTEENPMSGLEGRTSLLSQLGSALEARPDIVRSGRPGDILCEYAVGRKTHFRLFRAKARKCQQQINPIPLFILGNAFRALVPHLASTHVSALLPRRDSWRCLAMSLPRAFSR